MDKIKIFEKELGFIKDDKIRKFTEKCIEILPDYFFSIPSSSTGRYHPSYALGEAGLTKHVKAAVGIAIEIFNMNNLYNNNEKDMSISALLLHDGAKSGKEKTKFTVHEHPIIITEMILEHKDICKEIDKETLDIILTCIRSHMGVWTTNKFSKTVLPEPKTKIERFVHLCDYLASRKCLEFNFDVEITRK